MARQPASLLVVAIVLAASSFRVAICSVPAPYQCFVEGTTIDIQNLNILFTPTSPGANEWTYCIEDNNGTLPFSYDGAPDDNLQTLTIPAYNDKFATLSEPFTYLTDSGSQIVVSSMGYLQFTTQYPYQLDYFTEEPRFGFMFEFIPSAGGTVTAWDELSDGPYKFVVQYSDVPAEAPGTGSATYQIVLYPSTGQIGINILSINVKSNSHFSFLGLSSGNDATSTSVNLTLADNCTTTGEGTGDPHFVGFNGCKFNFDGEDHAVYAIYSDVDLQVNAMLSQMNVKGVDGTWMTKIGIRTPDASLTFDPSAGLLNMDDMELITSSEVISFNTTKLQLSFGENGLLMGMALSTPGARIQVEVKRFGANSEEFFLNVEFTLTSEPIHPHGVLGQTASDIGASTDCSRPMAGTEEDYVVSDGVAGIHFVFQQFQEKVSETILRRDLETSMIGLIHYQY